MSRRFLSLTFLAVLVACASASQAFFAGPMPGWERGSRYDALYDKDAYATVKGTLDEYVTVRPMAGMVDGLGLTMTDKRSGQKVDVHLGPMQYLDFLPEVIKPGDKIKVKGAYATIQGKKVFMASKIRKGEVFELKLRSTRTGSPYWDLDEMERLEETLEQ